MTDAAWVGAHYTGERWVAVAFDADAEVTAAVYDGVGDCWFHYEDDAERLLVDVPVGLSPAGERDCDRRARAVLGPRSSAIDAPPVPDAVRKRRHAVASRVQERQTGEPLAADSFARTEAIAVLRDLLAEFPGARSVVAESHPELCFRAFAGQPLERDPETAGGYAERLRTIASLDRDAPAAVQSAAESVGGHPVTVADVLDATALAYAARAGTEEFRSLPPDPPLDDQGLPMTLHYRAADPLAPS